MINLLKGEFYKLFKSRAFLVSVAVALFSVVFVYGLFELAEGIRTGEVENGTGGVVVSVEEDGSESGESILKGMTSLDVLQELCSSFGSFIIVIFASIFVVGEYTNGAVKNVVGKGYARWKIFAAKYISTSAAAVMLLLVMMVATMLGGAVVLKDQTVSKTFFTDLLSFTGIQILLGIALCGMSILISELCRTLGAGLTISLTIVTFSALIVQALNLLVRFAVPKTKFTFADYWPMALMGDCPVTKIGADFAVRAVLVGIGWVVVTAGSGALHFKKADVK